MASKLTGTWVGEYTYGPGYEGAAGKSVPFTMSLTEALRRLIAGYVRDDASRGGQPERGRISGRRRGRAVEFVKSYPVGYVVDDDGNQTQTRRELAEQEGHELGELPPHRIRYRGTLDDGGDALRGEWQILPWRSGDFESDPDGESGTWTARRTSYEPSEV